MKFLHLAVFSGLLVAHLAAAQVSITKSAAGWEMTNGNIQVELVRSSTAVQLKSLKRVGGVEWAVAGSPLLAFPERSNNQYRFLDDEISNLPKDGKQLKLRFKSDSGGLFSLMLRLYPTGAVIELGAALENLGQHNLLLDSHIDPLFLTLKASLGALKPYSSVQGQHGFQPAGNLSSAREFRDWIVLENDAAGESALIGGEPGLGVLEWKATTRPSSTGTILRAGTLLLKDKTNSPSPVDRKSVV